MVNDDTGSANHSNPAITVTDAGVLVVLWNDRRADPLDRCFRARASASLDGGATFVPSVPLTITDVCPATGDLADFSTRRFRLRFANGGETQGLAPLPGGDVLAVWVDEVDGVMHLRASAIRISQSSSR